MPDISLTRAVNEELEWDPRVNGGMVAAEADSQGEVTLRGTVGSFRQKHEAARAAARVNGVRRVTNELQVRFLDSGRRLDAALRADVLQALMLDTDVPSSVDADVTDGMVTLTGTATWQHEREEAERATMNVLGVAGIDDRIELTGAAPDAFEIKDQIEKAFGRYGPDVEGVTVKTFESTVTLTGVVQSLAEHDAAIRVAWAAPGVRDVVDKLEVAVRR